ncbi:ABC transporter ATP-binding protein [Amycolatopsis taiwanensis]|uniref:ABC transporter ATP-binding protein n=1 Tax=Amycolatopsis taiwanensis TaxID=342230 RepID=A0A9W6QY49_9PSEU|nr:ABC transporter ATP-binding protein [Amycolatopsis taiwanensis]
MRTQDLRHGFPHPGGDVDVLRGVDFSVDAGELVTVSGRSGSGKSALLALLGGFDKPNSGRIFLAGQPLGDTPPWHMCAVLPQTLGLATELAAAENVALPLRLHRNGNAVDIDARVTELLEALGVGVLSDRYPSEMSYGQQQRVALARAVSARPKVLIVDEPTAHLDAGSKPAVLRLLRTCADEGSAVIVATHDDEMHSVADRQLRLADGVLVPVNRG